MIKDKILPSALARRYLATCRDQGHKIDPSNKEIESKLGSAYFVIRITLCRHNIFLGSKESMKMPEDAAPADLLFLVAVLRLIVKVLYVGHCLVQNQIIVPFLGHLKCACTVRFVCN